jgi:hypothetical protein
VLCVNYYVYSVSKEYVGLTFVFPALSQRSIMGTAFGSAGKAWTYRYNQRVPGSSSVQHAAENWMMFKGITTGFVFFLLLHYPHHSSQLA